jgi:hypothetical protein
MPTFLYRKVIAACATILILAATITVLFACGFLTTTTPSTPLKYGLTLEPTNGIILQGQTLNATICANYIQGTPQKVTLTTDEPSGITCALANASGTPTESNPFRTTLQISASPNATSGSYQFNITAKSLSGNTNNTTFRLTILHGLINVSGTVTADFDDEITPTEITFENTKTHEKFAVGVLTTPITGVPTRPIAGLVQTGRYWVMLPNNADYSVMCTWMRVPLPGAHFDRAASGSFSGGTLTIGCEVGVDFLVGNNYDGAFGYQVG